MEITRGARKHQQASAGVNDGGVDAVACAGRRGGMFSFSSAHRVACGHSGGWLAKMNAYERDAQLIVVPSSASAPRRWASSHSGMVTRGIIPW